MTNRKNVTKTLGGLATAVLLTFSLAACSGDADVKAFCETGEGFEDSMNDVDASDPAAAGEAFDKLVTELKAAKAPEAIAADWTTLTEGFENMGETLTALSELDPTADDYMEKATELSDSLQSTDFQTAADNVEKWTTENCTA
ncbi:hypothetical protein [Oerskovia enterophila]|uniref:hypothetical protein n=1 Tax=Oerskovia enterophila TaxID=43678 RepID=UPI0033924067